MGDEETVLELNPQTDLTAVDVQCPVCGEKYMQGVPYVQVPCNKCGITYKTTFKQDIYTKKARQMLSKLSFHNLLKIKATERYESELIHIRQHFLEQNCWDVSEITHSTREYKRCECCGVCFDCFTCKSCQATFKKDTRRRKQACPECHSNSFSKTFFKKVEVKGKQRICPECASDNVRMTRTPNKTQCHLCGSKKLSSTRVNEIFEISISRKKAYRRENVPRS